MTGQQQVIELLQRHLAGAATATDGLADLAGSAGSDQQLAELLSRREAQLERDLAEAEQAELRTEEEARRLSERREPAEDVRRRVAELAAQLDVAHGLLDDMAAALGACPACFGADDTCWWCRGRGAPGFTTPDPGLFDRLVRPAVVMHARMHRRDRSTVTTDPPSMREGTTHD
ncbi:hypothetical protein ACWCXB_02250 [Streptomyces sp. NPDC001514]